MQREQAGTMIVKTASLKILDGKARTGGSSRGLCLLVSLSGHLEAVSEGGTFLLEAPGYLAVSSGEYYSASMAEDGLYGILEYDPEIAEQYLDLKAGHILACSLTDPAELRRQITGLLGRCFNGYNDREGDASLLIEAAACELLFLLKTRSYAERKFTIAEGRRDDRFIREQILSYLHLHYTEQVTLEALSNLTWFSEAYLSRYIRRQFGSTFTALLAEIRLDHAEEMVAGTEEKLIKIAMECGFPNTVAFNREFRRRYGMTPSAYRKLHGSSRLQGGEGTAAEDQELGRKISEYLRTHSESEELLDRGRTLRAEDGQYQLLSAFWCRMINAGLAKDLLRADAQEQLQLLHEGIGFTHVRFWDIWSPELMLYDGNPGHGVHFGNLDAVIAFLYNHGMYPYIDMGFKSVQLIEDLSTNMIFEDRKTFFRSRDEYCSFLEHFLRHYIRLYGEEYVEKWCLEFWMDPRIQNEHSYLDLFEQICSRVKPLLPGIRLGGAGFSREYGQWLEPVLTEWGKRKCAPDFLSVYLFPYDNGFLEPPEEEDGSSFSVYRGTDYVERFVGRIRELMRKNGLMKAELHLSEWNSTFVNRDPLNDDLYKGAYIVRSLIAMIGRVDVAGYWFASDLFASYYDSRTLLDGSGGLLSRDGICKPAYYGFEFFNRLGSFCLASDESGIITSGGSGRYRIVCHNYVHPEPGYFDVYEDSSRGRKREWPDRLYLGEERKLHFEISGVPKGTYIVKTRLLDREHGSVEDEWNRMGRIDFLDRRDVEYLRRISVPRILVTRQEVRDGLLRLTLTLPPNAIGNIHVFPAV